MSLTPVGAGLFLEGIDYSTENNHLLAKPAGRAIMIVEDAYAAAEGQVAYNATVKAQITPDSWLMGATADEVVEFVKEWGSRA